MKNKFLVLAAYLFFVPALYIILTEKRHDAYIGFQAIQAFICWLVFLLLYVLILDIRYNVALLASLWGLIAASGLAAATKEDFRIPLAGKLAERLF